MSRLSELINAQSSKIISGNTRIKDDDIDSSDVDTQLKLLQAARYSEDTRHRAWLAKWTAIVVTFWLAAVLTILALNKMLFSLSDPVLISLLGTTTLNVLGLSFIVLRGHFQKETK